MNDGSALEFLLLRFGGIGAQDFEDFGDGRMLVSNFLLAKETIGKVESRNRVLVVIGEELAERIRQLVVL